MAFFKGQADYSVDSKGRVALPAKMRRVVSPDAKETFTITRGLDRCIAVYPVDLWDRVEKKLGALNQFNRDQRKFIRDFVRWADEVTLDSQGRITIPKRLLDFAGITDKATIVGSGDHLEIWDTETLEGQTTDDDDIDSYQELAERVMGDLDYE